MNQEMSVTLIHIAVLFRFFFSSRRRHTRLQGDWSSDVCSSDLSCTAQPVKSWLSDTYQTNGCAIIVTRTYQAADACGNRSTCTQQITVQDTIAPEIGRASCRERV